jgi:hypothetical protein
MSTWQIWRRTGKQHETRGKANKDRKGPGSRRGNQRHLVLEQLEYRLAPAATGIFATGADAGGGPQVNFYNGSGALQSAFQAYNSHFLGGVRVAVGDVNGDGVPDIITAPGPGGGADIRIFDGATGKMIGEFQAYDSRFTGGVYVAVGDISGNGKPEIITGPDQGGGPDVRVFDTSGNLLNEFLAYGPFFTGGVRVAAGDVNGDGKADIITGAGPRGGPNVVVYDGANPGHQLQNFQAYSPFFQGGVYVAGGDTNGDGKADIITAPGARGGPEVKVFSGQNGSMLADFLPYSPAFTGGVRVGAADVKGDGRADIITAAGPSGGPHIQVLNGASLTPLQSFLTFNSSFTGGVFTSGDANGSAVVNAQPFDSLTIPGTLNPSLPTFAVFTDQSGHQIQEPATSVSASSIMAPVPVVLDPTTFQVTSGTMTASVLQQGPSGPSNQTTTGPLMRVNIASLPSTGAAPGALASLFFTTMQQVAKNAIQDFQNIAAASGGKVNVGPVVTALQTLGQSYADALQQITARERSGQPDRPRYDRRRQGSTEYEFPDSLGSAARGGSPESIEFRRTGECSLHRCARV